MNRETIVLLPILILLLIGSVATRARLDRQWHWGERNVEGSETLGLPSGAQLSRFALGFDGLLSDWYWIRTLHYFGSRAREGERVDVRDMPQLGDLIELTVTLDPRHLAAYRFGSFFLLDVDPGRALRLTRMAIRENPNEWRLYCDLGYIHWRAGRYHDAARAYRQGGELEGAPGWMKTMGATMLARGGDIATARTIFRELGESTDDAFVREVCRAQLELLDMKGRGTKR